MYKHHFGFKPLSDWFRNSLFCKHVTLELIFHWHDVMFEFCKN